MITIQDVREYVLDRDVQDDALGFDITFSDAEIESAMKRCAREFNSIPPYVFAVRPDALPDDSNIFLDGVVLHLYIARMAKLQRADFDYTAGGLQANVVAKELGHLKDRIPFYDERFRSAAQNIKIGVNLQGAYGQVG